MDHKIIENEHQESKADRFRRFVTEALKEAVEYSNSQNLITSARPLFLKIKIKDIGYSFFLELDSEGIKVCETPPEHQDAVYLFQNAKTVHCILSGKCLPLAQQFIGKFRKKYYKKDAVIFDRIFGPAKKAYSNIIRGTRFTLHRKKSK